MKKKKNTVTLRFKDDSFVNQLKDLLLNTGRVKIIGLGIFEIVEVDAREGYNVADGKRIIVPAHKRIGFRPTKNFRDLMQGFSSK